MVVIASLALLLTLLSTVVAIVPGANPRAFAIRDFISDSSTTTPQKPSPDHDAFMDAIRTHLNSVDVVDVDSRAPGYAELHDSILRAEAAIPYLARYITTPPSSSASSKDSTSQAGSSRRRRGGSPSSSPPPTDGPVSPADFEETLAFAEADSLTFCTKPALEAWNCTGCLNGRLRNTHNVTFFAEATTGMQGYVAVNEDRHTIIVAFRGTVNILNYIQDLTFYKTDLQLPNSTARVHAGFRHTWLAVRDSVVNATLPLLEKYPSMPITFTGHSLGGAVAVHAAMDFAVTINVPPSRIVIRTLGQPRIGDAGVGPYLASIGLVNYRRGVNYNDIVPHLPPIFLDFRHAGSESWVDVKGAYVHCNDGLHAGEDTNCANTIPPWVSAASHAVYFGVGMSGEPC